MLDTFLFLFPQVILSVYVWSHILHFRWQAEGSQTYIHTRLFLWFWRFPLMFKRVCLSVYVSFSMTRRGFSNLHACSTHFYFCFHKWFWACMFDRTFCIFDDKQRVLKHTYIHAYSFDFEGFHWCLSVYVWACMFHFPWHAEGFQTPIHA